jgi:hypothetical protein
MSFLNTFLYLNHESRFLNRIEFVKFEENSAENLEIDRFIKVVKEPVLSKNNNDLSAVLIGTDERSRVAASNNENSVFSFEIEGWDEPGFNEIADDDIRSVVYFLEQFPKWIDDLRTAFPMIEFKVTERHKIKVSDHVILLDDSPIVANHVIRAKGKKMLWRGLCELILNS